MLYKTNISNRVRLCRCPLVKWGPSSTGFRSQVTSVILPSSTRRGRSLDWLALEMKWAAPVSGASLKSCAANRPCSSDIALCTICVRSSLWVAPAKTWPSRSCRLPSGNNCWACATLRCARRSRPWASPWWSGLAGWQRTGRGGLWLRRVSRTYEWRAWCIRRQGTLEPIGAGRTRPELNWRSSVSWLSSALSDQLFTHG